MDSQRASRHYASCGPTFTMSPGIHGLPPAMNPWEIGALDNINTVSGIPRTSNVSQPQVHDPMIYPGLYSGSGFDLMSVLLQVMSRPNPVIELGPIDCSVAIIVCDLQLPDQPIIYCSDTFCSMTGYTRNEVLGQNCQFLQTPQAAARRLGAANAPDEVVTHDLSQAIRSQQESQSQILSYKKDGTPFSNLVSIVPVSPIPAGYRYAVSFQVELE